MKVFVTAATKIVQHKHGGVAVMMFLGCLFLGFSSGNLRAVGNLDLSFAPPSANDPIYAVAVDNRTNIWIGGAFTMLGGQSHFSLALLKPDGSINGNYLNNLGTAAYGYVVSLAVNYEGDVYVGYRNYDGGGGVARFKAPAVAGNAWQYDEAYSTNISAHISDVESIACGDDPSLDLYVAGSIENGGQTYPLAQFSSRGDVSKTASFPSLGLPGGAILQVTYRPAGAGVVNGQSLNWPDSLLVAGTFGVASVWMDGTVNWSYASPAGTVFSCAAERNPVDAATCPGFHGEALGGGQVEPLQSGSFNYGPYTGMILERLGVMDSTNYFKPISQSQNYPVDSGGFISRIIALPDGDMLVAGQFSSIRGISVQNFAHLLPDGSVDRTFPNHSDITVLDMVQQPDGKFLLAGLGSSFNGHIERRTALPTNGVSFNSQPAPNNLTVYEGDDVFISANVSSWPGLVSQWLKDGNILSSQTNMSLGLQNVTTNDAGDYQLLAQSAAYCPASVLSSNATLTVLPAPPAPANDLFADAISLNGTSATAAGTLRSATLEIGEIDASGTLSGRSVWWSWTAPFNGMADVDSLGCDFPAVVEVATGSDVAALSAVTNNYDYGLDCECAGLLTNIAFEVSAGTTYRIAIGGQPGVGSLGNITLKIGETVTSWEPAATPAKSGLYGTASDGHRLIAIGDNNTIITSTDGTNWFADMVSSDSSSYLVGAAYGNGRFIVTGDGGTILTSSDGINWTAPVSTTTNGLWGAVYGNGLFMAAGDQGVIVTSPDAVHWTEQTNGLAEGFDSLAFMNGLFVAVGGNGAIRSSADGTNWISQSSPVADELWGVVGANGQFVAVGDYGTVITSPDGTNWTRQTSGTDQFLFNVQHGNGHYVAVGESGALLLSTDGTNWVSDESGSSNDLYAVAYFKQGSFAVVGDNGTILFNLAPRLRLQPQLSDHSLQFSLNGLNGSTAIIEASPTLAPADWQPVMTNIIVHGLVTFTDVTTNRALYYRARIQ